MEKLAELLLIPATFSESIRNEIVRTWRLGKSEREYNYVRACVYVCAKVRWLHPVSSKLRVVEKNW
jgi:hypothetical protein